jgi:hypothetical protein
MILQMNSLCLESTVYYQNPSRFNGNTPGVIRLLKYASVQTIEGASVQVQYLHLPELALMLPLVIGLDT